VNKFSVSSDNATRIAVFADHIKKLNVVSAINEDQLFVLDSENKTLSIYAYAKAAQAEMKLDIDNVKVDDKAPTYFNIPLIRIVPVLAKIKGESVFSFDNTALTIAESGKKGITKITLFKSLDEQAISEIEEEIINIKASDDFKDAYQINLDNLDRISTYANLTKIIGTTDTIKLSIDGKNIYACDNQCVVHYSEDNASKDEIFLNNKLIPLLKNSPQFVVTKDFKYYYLNFQAFGIQMVYTPPAVVWEYPSEDDITYVTPDDTDKYELEINAKTFFDTLDKFKNMFQSAYWRYEQVFIETRDIDKNKELHFHFDDMATDVNEYLPIANIITKGVNDGFEWQLPTLHLQQIKSDLIKDDSTTFTMIYNGVEPGAEINDHKPGIGILIKSGNLLVMIAKLT
jgi:hypothetical protein